MAKKLLDCLKKNVLMRFLESHSYLVVNQRSDQAEIRMRLTIVLNDT